MNIEVRPPSTTRSWEFTKRPSIPQSIYWAIVTLTTVGYGDVTPATVLGKFIASLAMMTGYAIIAVPTGIVSVELHRASQPGPVSTQACPSCSADGHQPDAQYCDRCGASLAPEEAAGR